MINKKKLLVFMYWYTALGAGICGLIVLFFPELSQNAIRSLMPFPVQDKFVYGYMGSALLAFGVLTAMGISRPMKFVPVLMLQMVYKIIWIAAVVIPNAIMGELPLYAILYAIVFLTYIIGDIIAIPFGELLKKD